MEYKELIHGFLTKYGLVAPPGWDGGEALEVDDVSVSFKVDEAAGELILSAEVGDMPPDEKGRFAALLLKASSGLLSSNAEGAFCVDEDDVFHVVRSVPLAVADVDALASALESLVDLAEQWRDNAAAFAGVDGELEQQAFVRAMESKLGGNAEAIAAIRKSLGLPPDNSVPRALSARTMEPLTRQEVREIIDRHVGRTGGANAQQANADVIDRRNAVNLQNQRALPIRIGEQSFRLDKMAAELEKAAVTEPTKSQAAGILQTLTRPNGTVDIPTLAHSLNVSNMRDAVTRVLDSVMAGRKLGVTDNAQTNLNVSAGHGAEADEQRSVEGFLMKAADSLDYTRVAPLTDEQLVERIESEIRNNPVKYPLLTKYYLNAG